MTTLIVKRFPGFTADNLSEAGEDQGFVTKKIVKDQKGCHLSEVEFDAAGNELERFETEYDDSGNMIERKHFFEGELAETVRFEYDQDKRISREIIKYAEGGESFVLFKRDPEGKLVEKTVTGSDGEPEEKTLLKYEEDRVILEEKFDDSGDRVSYSSYEHFHHDGEWHIKKAVEWTKEDNAEKITENIFDTELKLVTGATVRDARGKVLAKQSVKYDNLKRIVENSTVTPSGNYLVQKEYSEGTEGFIEKESRYRDGNLYYIFEEHFTPEKTIRCRTVSDQRLGIYTEIFSEHLEEI